MPRKARLDAPGVLHHVMIRGIEKKPIFADDVDKSALVKRLGKVLPETQTPCYAWVFMDNHAHFLFRSSPAGISHVMLRLMTSYAGYFNRRHSRCGPLFQNRFKSVLCQENAYFKELVRYIHLNPLRAGMVDNVAGLASYRYGGHANLMGTFQNNWQNSAFVLQRFGKSLRAARRRYLAFVEAGADMGRRDDLTGGGLIRSMGGWTAVKTAFSSKESRQKSDQRILGDGDFVQQILAQAGENLERAYALRAAGVTSAAILDLAAKHFGAAPELILSRARTRPVSDARGLYCFWAVSELKICQVQLAKETGLSPAGVSYAVSKGRRTAKEQKLNILELLDISKI